MEMPQLNLPFAALKTKSVEGTIQVFGQVRKKYFVLTPEEWVRQNLLRHLIEDLGYPAGRTAVETEISRKGAQQRADIVVHSRAGSPVLVAECKSPDLKIGQAVFDQVSKYNAALEAEYLLVTNGLTHFCYQVDRESHSYSFLDSLPHYEEIDP